jgi:hypothetical protein
VVLDRAGEDRRTTLDPDHPDLDGIVAAARGLDRRRR